MSKKQDRECKSGKTQAQVAIQKKYVRLIPLALILAALVASIFMLFRGNQDSTAPSTGKMTGESVAAAQGKEGFVYLQGNWQRPDGGYVIEIRNIGAAGKMDASYFNPRPINVSQAEAALDGATVKVFIELRDVNYPGATYHLTYDPEKDQLRGVYFQPALQQKFDVFFVRMK